MPFRPAPRSGAPSPPSPSPSLPGLANLGNTCFMNSVLQSLNATRPLASLLTSGRTDAHSDRAPPQLLLGQQPSVEGREAECEGLEANELPILNGLSQLLSQLSTSLGALKPDGLLSSIAFRYPEYRRHEQADAHEFMHHLIESISSEQTSFLKRSAQSNQSDTSSFLECNSQPPCGGPNSPTCSVPSSSSCGPSSAPDWVLLDSLFEGSLTQYTVCERFHVSSVPEAFLDLSLATRNLPAPPLTRRARFRQGIERRLKPKPPPQTEADDDWHHVLLGGSSAPPSTSLGPLNMADRRQKLPAPLSSASLGASQLCLTRCASSESLPDITRAEPHLLAHILAPTPLPNPPASAPPPASGLRALRFAQPNPLLARVGWSSGAPVVESTGVEALLRSFTAVERLEGENRFACEACGAAEAKLGSWDADGKSAPSVVLRRAWRRYMISRLPPVVVVHLKRTEGSQPFISFPLKLDFKPYLCPRGAATAEGKLYGLYAVVVHRASVGGGGHYFAYVLSNRTGSGAERSWLYCSDAQVRKAAVEEVLKSTAYMLFYEQL